MPVVQDLLHSLGTGKIFTKLDLAQAYQHLPVDKETAEAQIIVTHRGAFKCHRLQFSISVAPGIFQCLMECLLQGIPGVIPYFDDVLVSSNNYEELMGRLRVVLRKFQTNGLKLRKVQNCCSQSWVFGLSDRCWGSPPYCCKSSGYPEYTDSIQQNWASGFPGAPELL